MYRTRPTASVARRITSALSALALALAGLTAASMPAKADDDLAKLLFGTAAIVIIGKALHDNNTRPKHISPPPYPGYPVHPVHPVHPRPPVYPPHPGYHPQPAYLPAVCAIQISGNRTVYYGERCMRQSGLAHRLPQSCARSMRTNRGTQTVYDGGCLINAGFRPIDRRHNDQRFGEHRRDERGRY